MKVNDGEIVDQPGADFFLFSGKTDGELSIRTWIFDESWREIYPTSKVANRYGYDLSTVGMKSAHQLRISDNTNQGGRVQTEKKAGVSLVDVEPVQVDPRQLYFDGSTLSSVSLVHALEIEEQERTDS